MNTATRPALAQVLDARATMAERQYVAAQEKFAAEAGQDAGYAVAWTAKELITRQLEAATLRAVADAPADRQAAMLTHRVCQLARLDETGHSDPFSAAVDQAKADLGRALRREFVDYLDTEELLRNL
ncbi:hypothetical protein [Pseudonocardia sp. NPDC049635]|uniref:hypothetical protein n=1 Tax=Pseudonocardia sp. NPDC049635 TaxID=3155506 RepID=UPI0033F38E35